MGSSHGEFVKYPITPHLFGSRGTADDKHIGEAESLGMLADESLIVEEKIDGTNVGIHFGVSGEMVLQCRGHLITQGMHPQYDLFKQWTSVKTAVLEDRLQGQFILFGEWVYARHSLHYHGLPHYFFEFDIYDKSAGQFLALDARLALLEGTGIHTVPVLHRGAIGRQELEALVGASRFDSRFVPPGTDRADNLMEGLYLRTEADGGVSARAKIVRPEFVEKIKQSEHWQHDVMVVNQLAPGTDIWS
ncbi:MAG: DNA ligase [Planctomycetota bacterium]|nr:MAG: DNA ligase [Planctomycetota bacterium]